MPSADCFAGVSFLKKENHLEIFDGDDDLQWELDSDLSIGAGIITLKIYMAESGLRNNPDTSSGNP